MSEAPEAAGSHSRTTLRWLTFAMFMMFAMTTDSVGVIIPVVIQELSLSMTAAGAFHYTTMTAIAIAGALLGFLADRLGRKPTILLGLGLFAVASYLFLVGSTFPFFLALLAVSGVAIAIFKTGALALVGDLSRSTTEHTATMNLVEGFFGVGAILGPALVSLLLARGISWKWLYAVAATLCVILIVLALFARYPQHVARTEEPVDLGRTARMARDPYALGFSLGAFLYVAVECAVYVWMPTLLAGYQGPGADLVPYALTVFFVLRAGGRFLGAYLLTHLDWATVTAVFSGAIFVCFAASVGFGVSAAVFLLPASGLFMSILYPTLNSKGMSCFPRDQHGAVSGVILFFTCLGAALGPLLMGALSDAAGTPRAGFVLATAFAALLFVGLLLNRLLRPTRARLAQLDALEYGR